MSSRPTRPIRCYPALTYVDRNGVIDRRTFTEIAREANRWAALLRNRGLQPGDRLLIFTAKNPTWVAILLGALKAGMVAVPCSEGVQTGELAWRAEDSGARLIVTDRERAAAVALMDVPLDVVVAEEAATELRKTPILQPTHDTAAADVAVILYTSKAGVQIGVTHTHGSTWAQRVPAEHWLEARPGDVVWCTSGPDGAESGWNLLLGPWGCGAELVIHEGTFDPTQRLDLLQRLGVTILCQTADEYRLLADVAPTTGAIQPGRLRHAVSVGEQSDEEATHAFQDAFGVAVWDGFGQTENTILVANTRGATVSPGSIGLPTPGHEIAVIDADGTALPAGVEGDLALHGRPRPSSPGTGTHRRPRPPHSGEPGSSPASGRCATRRATSGSRDTRAGRSGRRPKTSCWKDSPPRRTARTPTRQPMPWPWRSRSPPTERRLSTRRQPSLPSKRPRQPQRNERHRRRRAATTSWRPRQLPRNRRPRLRARKRSEPVGRPKRGRPRRARPRRARQPSARRPAAARRRQPPRL